MPTKNEILRARWEILRGAGVPARECRDARTSADKFSRTLAAAGGDPTQYPHLLNAFRGKRANYSMSKNAVDCRRRRAVLKAAGLDWVRTDLWCRSDSATEYALRALAAKRELPERPGLLRKAGQRFKDAAAAVAVVLLLCVNGWGCAAWPNDPPAYYSIDDQFSAAEAETIRSVFDAWCVAVEYCPKEALWSERGMVGLVDDLPETGYTLRVCPEGRVCSTSGVNHQGDELWIAANRVYADELAALWFLVAHEVGHYCTEHTARGLMAPAQSDAPSERELVIDADAIAAWRAGCP